MKDLYGVVAPIVTPLTDDDKIDVESLKRLVNHCIDNGINCLYPNGTTGEMMYLTVEERKLVAEVVVEEAAGRVPVFIHIGAWNLKDTLELARHAVSIGADGIGAVTPTFYKLSNRGLIDFYKAISDSVPKDFPIYLYSIPQNAINDIDAKTAETIALQCPNVVGIKYSYPDMTRIQEFMPIKNACGESFRVFVGPDHLFEAVCAIGGAGTVSGNSICIPEHYVAVWKAINERDFESATKYQRQTNVLNSVLCKANNIAAYKVVLKAEGVIATTKMRRPMENLSEQEEKWLLEELKRLDYRKVQG